MDDALLRGLALIELVGKPVTGQIIDELYAIVGVDSARVAMRLAALLRSQLEEQWISPETWVNEYRRRELADDTPGMA